MIPKILDKLSYLENNPYITKKIFHGIEREGLRIDINGNLSNTSHPKKLGSSLTHKWITTDFSESLLELITPKSKSIKHALTLLRDLHRYITFYIPNERIWPMSMPCSIENVKSIRLAQYGNSNIGRMKTLYRIGLKNRYNSLVQVISGIHYNFSFSRNFWNVFYSSKKDVDINKEFISSKYLNLIRNYYKFGWIIPYLFGASPGICSSFAKDRNINLPLEKSSELLYLPYATSLRLSNLGYINKFHKKIGIQFNRLDEYVSKLQKATKTPHSKFQKKSQYLQLNPNILQIESELYTQIRPKRKIIGNKSLSDVLMQYGIEYIEIRSLDINPFSPIGIKEDQIKLLNLFLIWCTLIRSPKINSKELYHIYSNWNRVVIEGRKPGLMIGINYGEKKIPINVLGISIFEELKKIATIFDSVNNNENYKKICEKYIIKFEHPELTLSAKILEKLIKYGVNKFGLILSNNYHKILNKEPMELFSKKKLDIESTQSIEKQKIIEQSDRISFEEFLKIKNIR